MGDSPELSHLERTVMEGALAGDHPVLEALRRQFEVATVKERQMTGVGFFVHFNVDRRAPRSPRANLEISDVGGSIEGLEHGAGFLVFVTDGYLDFLEGYCYEDAWPERIKSYEIMYAQQKEGGVNIEYRKGAAREMHRLGF